MQKTIYSRLEDILDEVSGIIQPTEHLTAWEAAEKYRFIDNPGSYVGPYLIEKTPYLKEPLEVLTSRDYDSQIFVGPAQSGKTDMFFNFQAYLTKCEPADMMLVHMSKTAARDFSIRKFDRFHRDCPQIGKLLDVGTNKDNTFDKQYMNGIFTTMTWPSVNELSSKTVPFVWITDYDRMPLDVDGEGSVFDLAKKRTTIYRTFGKTVAESSPGHAIQVSLERWVPETPHLAPPADGILSLYNRGDRRRWYWHCVDCGHWFEPRFKHMVWPESRDIMECAEQAAMRCPNCMRSYNHVPYEHNGKEIPGKYELNANGKWCPDGQHLDHEGNLVGNKMRSKTASFWLFGPAAAFADWSMLVANYLKAQREYEATGNYAGLKATLNLDQGEAHSPPQHINPLIPENLAEHKGNYLCGNVPEGVRFIITSVDVQKHRFEVAAHGFGVNGDVWVLDRYAIRKSERTDEDGDPYPLMPHAYIEDWQVLLDVINKRYPLLDGSGRTMESKMVVCDSGGLDGTTGKAYEFYRNLRQFHTDIYHKFMLVKGLPNVGAKQVRVEFPESNRNDKYAGARGEIPVLMINSNMMKDLIDAMLHRDNRGDGGYVAFPSDYDQVAKFEEFTVEIRDDKGRWVNPMKKRNEGWDLLYYAVATAICSQICGIDLINWDRPPKWAAEWDENTLVRAPVDSVAETAEKLLKVLSPASVADAPSDAAGKLGQILAG